MKAKQYTVYEKRFNPDSIGKHHVNAISKTDAMNKVSKAWDIHPSRIIDVKEGGWKRGLK